MADEQLIKPRELNPALAVYSDDAIMTDDGVTVSKATPVQIVDAGAPVATEAEAIAGTDNTKRMTPLGVQVAINSASGGAVTRAQAWAESPDMPDPAIPGSKSSKSWALEALQAADDAEAAADSLEGAVAEVNQNTAAIAYIESKLSEYNEVIFRKSIVASLPLRWPTAQRATDLYGWVPDVPQGMGYDEAGNLYLQYPGVTDKAVIVIYDRNYQFQRWFVIPASGESIVVRGSPDNGDLRLYCRSGSEAMGRYNLGSWPANEAEIAAPTAIVISSGVGLQYCYSEGSYLVEQATVDLGVTRSRTVWNRYDEDFNMTGRVYTNISAVGFQTTASPLYWDVPKIQGVAVKDGKIYFGIGGSYRPAVDGPVARRVADNGVMELGPDGTVMRYGVLDANKFLTYLMGKGLAMTRIESEGVTLHPDGSLHHLQVTLDSRTLAPATTEGVTILREMDPKGDYLADMLSVYSPTNWDRLTRGIYPRGPLGIQNPITQAPVTTMAAAFDMMVDLQLPRFSWFSGAESLTPLPDLSGIAGNYVATVENVNNVALHLTLESTSGSPWYTYDYRVLKEGGVWRAQQRSDSGLYFRLGGKDGVDATTTIGRMTLPHRTASEEDVLLMQATQTAGGTQMFLGGSSSLFNAIRNLNVYCADTDTTTTGDESLSVWRDRVTAGRDNEQTLGSAARRWSQVFAATGTINTSDARTKTEVRELTAAEVAAASDLAREIGAFKFLDAVAAKGDGARLHVGMTVQRAIEIMESHGLDPLGYGFICYDEWEAGWDENAEGEREAGRLYGFRHDELSLFIARGQAQRQDYLEARIAALEAKGIEG